MTSVSRPDAPEIPGLVLRVHGGGIEPAALMAPIVNAVNEAAGVDELTTTAELQNWLGHRTEAFDPAADVVLAEVDGVLVGYAWNDWVDTSDGLREFRLGGYVHPDWQGRGIGRRLLAWQEERVVSHPQAAVAGRPLAIDAEPSRRIVIVTSSSSMNSLTNSFSSRARTFQSSWRRSSPRAYSR